MRAPPAGSHLELILLKIVLSFVFGGRCSPDLGFYRVDWASGASCSKVSGFVVEFVCTFRKQLKNTTQSQNCVLPKRLLSFSLRFCSAFRTHCKTRLKLKIPPNRRDSFTCSHEKRFFEIDFEKTTVARTRVQSVLALGTFTAVS